MDTSENLLLHIHYKKNFRLCAVTIFESFGRPIGTELGSYLWKNNGYLAVFGTSTAIKVLILVLLVTRLELFRWKTKQMAEQKEKTEQTTTNRHLLSILQIKEIYKFLRFYPKESSTFRILFKVS